MAADTALTGYEPYARTGSRLTVSRYPPEVSVSVASDLVSKLPRQARWAVPAAAVAAVGLVIAGAAIAGAEAAPQLPARSTAQVVAAVDAPSALPSAMQAVVQETANLGLPDLPGSGSSDPLSGLSLLSGAHTFKIWYDGPTRVRIAIPVTLGETDLRRDGRDVWLWDSKTSQATHYVLPAQPGSSASTSGTSASGTTASGTTTEVITAGTPTPQQVARQILAAVGQTTTVGLQPNVMVAGQAAYQPSLAPKASRSLIGHVRIAIDAGNSLPLRVQIFARGASSPALEVGYTSLSFTRPAASNFPFTPPPGATVKTVTVPAAAGFPPGLPFPEPRAWAAGAGSQAIINKASNGGGFILHTEHGKVLPAKLMPSTVVLPAQVPLQKGVRCVPAPGIPSAALKQMRASIAAQLTRVMTQAQPTALLKSLQPGGPGTAGRICSSACSSSFSALVPLVGGPTVIGHDWLSVLVLPAGGLAPGGLPVGVPTGTTVYGSGWVESSSGTVSSSSPVSGTVSSSQATVTLSPGVVSGGPGVDVSGLGGTLLSAARPVHGAWGSGRLLRTSLISVLITSDGEVLIGAVQPSVLYADAAQLK